MVGDQSVVARVQADVAGGRRPGPLLWGVYILQLRRKRLQPDKRWKQPVAGFDQRAAVSAREKPSVPHAGGHAAAPSLDQAGHAASIRRRTQESDALIQQTPAMHSNLVLDRQDGGEGKR